MKLFVLSLAALAVLIPAFAGGDSLRAQSAEVNVSASPERQKPELGIDAVATPPFRALQQARRPEPWRQVRIERRVIIRISPGRPDRRERMMAALPQQVGTGRFEEVPHDDCVAIDSVAGVQPTQDNRLLLFMRDREVLAASLERSCSARAFYSGFYLERSEDGRLCIARDRLQSRAGASCRIEQLTRFVPTGD